ncbi:MAG TPA: ThuA domain-containing protein [Verrucomicrobiae bacterium]|nr:ThuA domain-containing protein [Verrucomicrobiae bacterium]
MKLHRSLCCVAVAAMALVATKSSAVERWADPKLPVREGLALWLDASRENAAREGRRPLVANGGPLDQWHDASGLKRDLRQPVSAARPRLIRESGGAVVRFDGNDDFLSAANLESSFTNITLFIRATPRTNAGGFRAFLAFNRSGENDYTSGMTVDFSFGATPQFESLNVEGRGFTGAQDLLSAVVPFGVTHTLTITSDAANVRVWLDSLPQGMRPRSGGALALDEFTLGARHYSNSAEPPFTQGFFNGDIAEVLLYRRVLSEAERAEVERYLGSKHTALELDGRRLVPLIAVSNPPPVQMFVPGFIVRELPVKLSNINCVKYRPDGRLVALGYDGRVWLLADTDGDGLEDRATPFWSQPALRAPIGLALTPPGYARGQGAFIASKGKVSLIVDTNTDDVADEEIIIAQGWKELPHGVDALGVAVSSDGSIYFGLGTANFTDAYLIDRATGQARYDLKDERGAILKVSPDFMRREILCTGVRFPVALAFNEAGDLFCTDQEGATWLPNGNPLDELLHLEAGRHYGFPPRHPKHLPGVIDEPSVFDYRPQHQSTCGLNFNLLPGRPVSPAAPTSGFGPAWWRGDALVAGYSRGKLWRTKLAKTAAGYVAQNQLVASLNMLAVDACVSPRGSLLVAVHSGQPDWGSGPNGEGKLHQISFADTNVPQPVLVWAASPTETHVEFDRPLDASRLKALSRQITIAQGRHVAAGDRFEVLRPGYQVVQNQLAEPRYEIEVFSTVLEGDGRTLVLRSAPRRRSEHYAITLPLSSFTSLSPLPSGSQSLPAGSLPAPLPQHPVLDLAHDLTGVEASWRDSDGVEQWTGWLPHLDLAVARVFTSPSAAQARLWALLAGSGRLVLRTQLDLWQVLRSATQPGSKLDFDYPPEQVTVVFKSSSPIALNASAATVESVSERETRLVVQAPHENRWTPLELTLASGSGSETVLEASWFTVEDPRPRALPLRRLLLPWVVPDTATVTNNTERAIPEITGGNWRRGKRLFFEDKLACSQCHVIRGEGRGIGPDLSNLIHRDYASVMKDIAQPSAAINPDHVAYNIELKNGDFLSGVPVGGNAAELWLAVVGGKTNAVSRSEVATMSPSALSLMPEGLLQGLAEQQVKDLCAFLLMPPPLEPAPLEATGAPPPRPRAELQSVLNAASTMASENLPQLRILLATGPKDHGPGEHDYPLWQKRWSKLLALADEVTVDTAFGWPTSGQFAAANVIVFYSNNPGWSAARATELDAFLNRGGGLVYVHYAIDGHDAGAPLTERIGLAWSGGRSRFRHGPLELDFADTAHPITRGFRKLALHDESYWNLTGDPGRIHLLANGAEEGAAQPLLWVREAGKGRVFVSVPGHYNWTFDDPLFRLLLLRGICWTAHQPADRLSDLITIGARLGE